MYMLNIQSYWEEGKGVTEREEREKTWSDFSGLPKIFLILLNHWSNYPFLNSCCMIDILLLIFSVTQQQAYIIDEIINVQN